MINQKLPKNRHEREKLRDKGQFWTPDWVAEAMISYIAKDTDLVFDPAAGRGAFFNALLNINPSVTYFGTDIDEELLQDEIYKKKSCITELRDFIKNPPKQRFKAIIANPPYIRHHRIDEKMKQFLKKLFVNITGFTIDGRAGYHIYFFIQALNLLDNSGKLAFIMPADTCEGVFAKKLWKWITDNFCLECVVTFHENATPFPNVDTNALIFFIKKSGQLKTIQWVKANEAHSKDFFDFVRSDFKNKEYSSLEIIERDLEEALKTGLSRPEQNHCDFKYCLKDFARVMRGIATGANDFFFLTRQQAEQLKIPNDFLKLAIGRTKDVTGDKLTSDDIRKLQKKNRPTLLLSINSNTIPESLAEYIKQGEKSGLPDRPLIRQRRHWYKMEQREIPPILFAYLGRRNSRFIKNEAEVVPLTCFLCLYPKYSDEVFIANLWQALNHPETIKNLRLVGKSYGSGAIKLEPRSLDRVPIPEHIVEKYNLRQKYESKNRQLELF